MVRQMDLQKAETDLEELEHENRRLLRGYESLSQRLIGLRMLQDATQDLISELDVDRLLKRILYLAINAVEGMAGSLLLLDPSTRELVFAVVEGGGGEALQGQRMPMDQGIAGWTVCHNEPVIVTDVREDPRFFEQIPAGVHFGVTSLICAPLVTKGEVIGAIQILNKAQGAQFDDDDLDLMTSFAAQSAAAIENARLYQDVRRERDRLIAVEEDIRRRLARDLHDGPAQLLAAIIINIEFIRQLLEYEPTKVLEELNNMVPLAQKALRQLRTLLFDLRPVILETQGLAPALELYVEKQREGSDLGYHVQVSGFSGRLAAQAERVIFSIVQEAVGNVRKHAKARNVWIAVSEQDGCLQVEVRDDGRGFDVDKLNAEYDQRGSLGTLNMREYAQAIGGKLSVSSRPGGGTTVTLTAPLPPLRQ
jgi:signal transduction histidine kinase